MSPAEDRWHSVKETAEHFKVGLKKVYGNCKSGAWPHHRAGGHVRSPIRFSPEDWVAIEQSMRPAGCVPAATVEVTFAQLERGRRRLERAA